MRRRILPLLLVLFLPSCLRAGDRAVNWAELERVALEELKQTNTPGAAVAVVSGDRVVFAKGFGVASVETAAPVTPDMLFRLGSTTKMMTAAALVSLAVEGKFKLDEPVGTYIKGLSPALARLTAHQLLSHTAGLQDEAPMDGLHDDSALAARVLAWNDEFLFTEPGQIYSYSNPGYVLAGFLLEQLGGKPYADMMAERVFRPLGMSRTTLRPTVAMTYPLAQGHRPGAGGKPEIIRPAPDYAGSWPAGSVFTSARDFARFGIAFLNDGKLDGKEVLPPTVIARLATPYSETHGGEDARYGYGLVVGRQRGVRMLSHGGSRAGYGSLVYLAPEHRFAALVLANRSGAGLRKTAEKAMELLLPLEPKTDEAPKPPLPMRPAEVQKYVGVYVNGEGRLEVLLKDGKLFLKQGARQTEVNKIGPSRFSFKVRESGRPPEFSLLPGPDGSICYLHLGGRAHRRTGT